MLLRHDICCMDTRDVLLLEKNICRLVGEEYMSSCGGRICLLVGEEYMVSSCWRRIYGYGRCLLVGEEYMAMEDVFLLEKNIFLLLLFVFLFLFLFLFLVLVVVMLEEGPPTCLQKRILVLLPHLFLLRLNTSCTSSGWCY